MTNDVEWLPDHVALVTYFACNEAIQNAMKHAGPAATIDVDIRLLDDQNGSRVEFSVADDGVGCDQGRLEAGHGIRALSHRLDEVGGTLVATSEPGCGTRLTGTIPVMR
ncbi:MAG TPA: ATP-binding protein [Ilumatobacteraceae bacterium]|nr:ATP-binding protein [Ilumatobacteraceae bacterium]